MKNLFFSLFACLFLASCVETPQLSVNQKTADFNAPAIASEKPDQNIMNQAGAIAVANGRRVFTPYKIKSNFKDPNNPSQRLDRWRVLMP